MYQHHHDTHRGSARQDPLDVEDLDLDADLPDPARIASGPDHQPVRLAGDRRRRHDAAAAQPRETLPYPVPGAMPVAWTGRLLRALQAGDRQREQAARRELSRLGITIRVDRAWRRGAAR